MNHPGEVIGSGSTRTGRRSESFEYVTIKEEPEFQSEYADTYSEPIKMHHHHVKLEDVSEVDPLEIGDHISSEALTGEHMEEVKIFTYAGEICEKTTTPVSLTFMNSKNVVFMKEEHENLPHSYKNLEDGFTDSDRITQDQIYKELCENSSVGKNVHNKEPGIVEANTELEDLSSIKNKMYRGVIKYLQMSNYKVEAPKRGRRKSSKQIKPHKCPMCTATFISLIRVKNHLWIHKHNENLCCQVCKIDFPCESLEDHLLTHRTK